MCYTRLWYTSLWLWVLLLALPRSCFGWTAAFSSRRVVNNRLGARTPQRMSLDDDDFVFPVSTRQALIQKAQSLDSSLETKKTGSYSARGWSNRLGTALTPASIPNVYTADRPFYWNKIDVGCRMTVVVLENKDIWVHSPVPLDGPLQEALDQLGGKVKHVMSPNYEHVKYAKQWADAYPQANMWACPGLAARETNVPWRGEVPYGMRPKAFDDKSYKVPEGFWDTEEIQMLHIDCEVNPFTGKPFFNEVIFYHKPSKTLITTDLYWNYPKGDGITNSNFNDFQQQSQDLGVWELAPAVENMPLGSRLWKVGMDNVFRPFYMNLMVKQKSEFREIANFICNGWDVKTIVPAHGDIVRGKGLPRTILQKHFNLES